MQDQSVRIDVPRGLHWQSRFFAATASLWRRIGDLETSAVADEIEGITVENPVYVTSLARAGTTIVTELLESHPALTCHHYSDFPNFWTPYWRNYLVGKTRKTPPAAIERAHRDRIMVNQDSPEAVEEGLWMHFFKDLHDPGVENALDSQTENPAFERYYTDHIRKLLAVRNAQRYLAKGNYNISRLAYLHRLYPGARFVIPLRSPEQHIASLAKQHALFSMANELDQRVGRQLAMSGHLEFGPYRRAVHFGNQEISDAIRSSWSAGREIEGWARYWAETYRFLSEQLEASPELAGRCFLFRYEDLCSSSEAVIDAMLAHCDLDATAFTEQRARYAALLTPPEYYRPAFDKREIALIQEHCTEPYMRVSQRCFEPPSQA